jgi:hypothetical protein
MSIVAGQDRQCEKTVGDRGLLLGNFPFKKLPDFYRLGMKQNLPVVISDLDERLEKFCEGISSSLSSGFWNMCNGR